MVGHYLFFIKFDILCEENIIIFLFIQKFKHIAHSKVLALDNMCISEGGI